MIFKAARRSLPALFVFALAAGCSESSTSAATESAAGPEASASANQNWVRTMSKTEQGGYLIGNPNAPVKLLEFGSLACSHCATFHAEAMDDLKNDYIRSGNVSYELRTFVLNSPDYVATALARCSTPERFFKLSDALFENQRDWLSGFGAISEEDGQRLASMPPERAMTELGKMGGLDGFVRVRGIPAAEYQKCVGNQQAMQEIEAIRADALENYSLTGTPTFAINGERIDASNWSQVKASLDEAL